MRVHKSNRDAVHSSGARLMLGAPRSELSWALWIVAVAACAAPAASRAEDPATLNVDVGKPGVAIPAGFFGLMTEEINHSYDGGLFAELIQNRTFQDRVPHAAAVAELPIHWSVVGPGKVTTDEADPVNSALPVSLKLDIAGGESGVANDGYWGIPVRPDTTYTASFYAKGGGGFAGPVTASIRTDEGDVSVARADIPAGHRRVAEVHVHAQDRARGADHVQGAVRPLGVRHRAACRSASSRCSRRRTRTRRTACGPT